MIRTVRKYRVLAIACLLSSSLASVAAAQEQSLPFMDAGNIAWERFTLPDTEDAVGNYIRQGSPEWHQNYMTGRQIQAFGDGTRRSWFVFDASNIDNASTAVLRIWGMQATPTSNGFGVYTSEDTSETFVLHSIEHTLPADVLVEEGWGRPGDEEEGIFYASINQPIWEDLADGPILGSRVFNEADDVGPGPELSPTPLSIESGLAVDCLTDATAPCGRYYDITLNELAVSQINSANGAWMFGGEIPTALPADEGGAANQWLFPTHFVDLPGDNLSSSFRQPPPQLVITLASAVPVFGGGFTGLVALSMALAGAALYMMRRRVKNC